MDANEWVRLKRAAIEYARYRPHLETQLVSPVGGTTALVPPTGVFGVEGCNYGIELTYGELLGAPDGFTGWVWSGGLLHLTPVPASTTIRVVWRKLHTPDELSQTFPTIPTTDMQILQWLADAEDADEAQAATEAGLTSYTIGSTTVKWSGAGGGQPSGATRANTLRQRALQQLSGSLAEWG